MRLYDVNNSAFICAKIGDEVFFCSDLIAELSN